MKKIITILIITIIIVIMIIVGILLKIKSEQNSYEILDVLDYPEIPDIEIDNIVRVVDVRNEYYIVKSCITKYYSYYNDLYNQENLETLDDNKYTLQALYEMLDKKYIEFKDITIDNLDSKLSKIEDVSINIDDMYMCQKSQNVACYFVYGTLMDKSTSKFIPFSIMVNLDMLNRSFTICLQDYIENKFNVIKEGDKIQLDISDNIDKKTYNLFEYEHIDDNEHTQALFSHYKNNVIYNEKAAYDSLDKNYQKARFRGLEEFTEFSKISIRKMLINKLDSYQVDRYDEYTQYAVIDTKGNTYIFRETAPMKYTVLLDTYSIDIPEFTEQYDSTTIKGRVVLNIQKFKDALNAKDINYIYNNLSEGFRNSKFKTKESLKEYIEKNLNSEYSIDQASFESFKNEGETYIYNVLFKDQANEQKSVKIQFIMQLLEDRKYVMSFSIQND